MKKQLFAMLCLAGILGVIFACGSGGGGITTSRSSSHSDALTYRTMTGTIAEASSSAPGESISEATHSFDEINRIKCVDHHDNTYIASVVNGEFSINLPVGYSYTVAFMADNNFVAVLSYNDTNWFKMHAGNNNLTLGQVQINLTTRLAQPENNPWENNIVDDSSPFTSTTGTTTGVNIPDVFFDSDTMAIVTTTLPKGLINVSYSTTLSVAGGQSPYTWSITSGTLPAGLSLNDSSGEISGTPTEKGSWTITFMVTDTNDKSYSQDFTLTIVEIVITTTTLSDGWIDVEYSATLSASGGTEPYTWSIISGSLPDGLSLDSSGEITGTPTTTGTASFTVRATDSESKYGDQELTLKVTHEPGSTKWTYSTGGWVYSTPAISNGYVYAGSRDFKLYCLNEETGAKVWEFATGGRVDSNPVVVSEKVYFFSDDGKAYCLNATTGAKIWEYAMAGNGYNPTVADGKVFVGANCLNADTGALIRTFAKGPSIYGEVAVSGNYIYFGNADYNVYCYDITTGAEVWQYTTGLHVRNAPAISGGFAYAASQDGKVYCLDATTGAKKWEYNTGSVIANSSPIVINGYVYIGSDNNSYAHFCLNADTGAKVWSSTEGYSAPSYANGYIYITGNSYITCFKATSGESVWSIFYEQTTQAPAIINGCVFFGCSNGKVYCLYAPESEGDSWPMYKYNAARTGSK